MFEARGQAIRLRGWVWGFSLLLLIAACASNQSATAGGPVVPTGFDSRLLEILVCPEDLSPLHFATRAELNEINQRIQNGALKRWNGAAVTNPMEAVLLRQDNRIGYEVQERIPRMLLPEALVLDETVGAPDPWRHRNGN